MLGDNEGELDLQEISSYPIGQALAFIYVEEESNKPILLSYKFPTGSSTKDNIHSH